MKFRKLRSIEIFSNGSLNFSYANLTQVKQRTVHEKDYKSLSFTQKYVRKSDSYLVQNLYKERFKF